MNSVERSMCTSTSSAVLFWLFSSSCVRRSPVRLCSPLLHLSLVLPPVH